MSDDASVHSSTDSAHSPVFDIPEFPSLRRVKPLPKRRRTSDRASDDHAPSVAIAPSTRSVSAVDNGNLSLDVATEDLAKALSTTMALQSYYMPIFNGVLAGAGQHDDIGLSHVRPSIHESLAFGYSDVGCAGDEADQGDGDLTDHLQQPGNTKKRKVPVNASSRIGDANSVNSGEEDVSHGFVAIGRRDDTEAVTAEDMSPLPPPPPPLPSHVAGTAMNRNRLSAAANAALKHKDLLRRRKRQLVSLLGTLAQGDTLALDMALCTSYSLAKLVENGQGQGANNDPTIRLSRRHARRRTRLALMAFTKGHIDSSLNVSSAHTPSRTEPSDRSDGTGEFSCDFTYECTSPTSDRLRALRDEVAVLHAKIEAGVKLQADKEAEAARQTVSMLSQPNKVKRRERSQQRSRTTSANDKGVSATPGNGEKPTQTGNKSNTKKKRSALANASNPHHLRNYVPSRLPHSGVLQPAQAVMNAQNLLGPHAVRFLSAEVRPRRKKTAGSGSAITPLSNLVPPEEEWICAFCEYKLFYGDERGYQEAIRNRRKVLSRRRRALERAAAAASGRNKKTSVTTEKGELVDDDDDEENGGEDFEDTGPSSALKPRNSRTKVEQERDRDKGGSYDTGGQRTWTSVG